MGMGQVACAADIPSDDCKFPPIAYTELTQKQRACYWTVFYVMITSRNASFEDATVSAVPNYSLSEEALEGNLVSKRQNVTWVVASFFLRTIFKRFFREMLKNIIHPPSVHVARPRIPTERGGVQLYIVTSYTL